MNYSETINSKSLDKKYFDIAEVSVLGEPLIITRTGFTNELGWEFYLRPENNAEKIGDLIL